MSPNQAKLFPIVIAVVAIVAIGLQVPAIAEQRNLAEDQQKSEDISTLSSEVQTYSSTDSSLPSSLSELTIDDKALTKRLGDYKYQVKSADDGTFEICATFKTEGKGNSYTTYPAVAQDARMGVSMAPEASGDPYKHGKGNECFTFQSYYSYKYADDLYSGSDTGVTDTISPIKKL